MPNVRDWLPPLRAGRQAAGRAVLGWSEDPGAPRICRVAGAPGSGKTHLVTWPATAATTLGAPAGHRPAALLPGAGVSLDAAVWLLAEQLFLGSRTPAELLAELGRDARPRLILLWDLDRAAELVAVVRELVAPLLALPHLRIGLWTEQARRVLNAY
ncbi:hypothetical protein ACIRBX_23585 [Kitasatospora sp. NPDC096147]|uniref:hypothetical protein n=1 Tax=Kitasatospora sp. NPDC096147 TaxID=3364093 RepID=UPI0037FBC9EF